MKHIYTLALTLLLGFTAQAREFTFYQGNTPVQDGSTIYYSDVQVTDYGAAGRDVVINPDLYVTTDIFTATATVTFTCREGVQLQMCCGGQCESGTTVTKSGLTIQTGQKLPLQFEYVGFLPADQEIPTVTVDFEVKDTRYTTVSSRFTLVMGPGASASLTKVETGGDALSYTGGALHYALTSPADIALYSITGAQVLAFHADGQGSVNTHPLVPGVYIYSIRTAAGRTTGKLHVKG